MLPIGVRPRQLSVRTLLAGMCLTQADRPARPPHPGPPGADQPARGRAAAARRDRGLEARPAPAHLPAGRADLRPGRRTRSPRTSPTGCHRRRCRRPAMTCSRPSSRRSTRTPARRWPWTGPTWSPSPGPRRKGPATAPTPKHPGGTARTTCCAAKTSCSTATTSPPATMMPDEHGPPVPEFGPPHHPLLVPPRPGPRVRPRPDRDARRRDPARRHPRRLRLRPPRSPRTGQSRCAPPAPSSSRTCTPHDRGPNGTHHGAIISNGNLYCPARPAPAGTRAAGPRRHPRAGRRPRRPDRGDSPATSSAASPRRRRRLPPRHVPRRHGQDPLPAPPRLDDPGPGPARDPHPARTRQPAAPSRPSPSPRTSWPRPRRNTTTPLPRTAAPTHAAPAPNAASPPSKTPPPTTSAAAGAASWAWPP